MSIYMSLGPSYISFFLCVCFHFSLVCLFVITNWSHTHKRNKITVRSCRIQAHFCSQSYISKATNITTAVLRLLKRKKADTCIPSSSISVYLRADLAQHADWKFITIFYEISLLFAQFSINLFPVVCLDISLHIWTTHLGSYKTDKLCKLYSSKSTHILALKCRWMYIILYYWIIIIDAFICALF